MDTYEKKYKESLALMVDCIPDEDGYVHVRPQDIFPELKGLGDEKIRKTLIDFFQDWRKNRSHCWGISVPEILAWLERQGEHANFRNKIQIGDKVTRNKDGVLVNLSQLNRVAKKDEKQGTSYTKKDVDDAYVEGMAFAKDELEKQGEQKHAWSEEDEKMLNSIIEDFGDGKTSNMLQEYWLKSIKDRVQPQPNQEWSEEDEVLLSSIINTLEMIEGSGASKMKIDFLKSLKERYIWKPSEEQVHAFEQVYDWYNNNFAPSETLTSLYKDLEKLKGE